MKTLRFKEIDAYMKEYWKTHTIVPPREDDPLYIAGRIKENLTMDKKPITIIIDNYCGQKITFTMSEDADVESMFWLDDSSKRVTDIRIKAHDKEILINKEDK